MSTEPEQTHAEPAQPTSTRLSKRWLLKFLVFAVVLLVFGFWGLADAVWIYPSRQHKYISYRTYGLLQTAERIRMLTPSGLRIEDPAAELAELSDDQELEQALERVLKEEMRLQDLDRDTAIKKAKLELLQAVAPLYNMSAERYPILTVPQDRENPGTVYWLIKQGQAQRVAPDGSEQSVALTETAGLLSDRWKESTPPTPLSGFDIPVQWLFVGLGFPGALYIFVMILRAKSRTYRWEPESHTLTLHNDTRVSPENLADIDKSRWHKFYATLELKDGSSHELDLYRYEPLEDWVLALEARAFPDRVENSEQDNGEQPSGGEPADTQPAATDQDQSPTTP